MKMLKKICAVLMAGLLTVAAVGCHPKDEIAVTVSGEKFTSAYYMCALINADMEARQKVDEKKDAEDTSETDYYAQKIEKKSFAKWVKDKALETLKEIAAYKIKCEKAGLTVSEEDENNAKTYASYYWSSYGYSQLFEPNGVSEATYTKYMLDASYADLFFEHLYGVGGEKEIAPEKLQSTMQEKLLLADQLDVSFSEETDGQKTEIKSKLDVYVTALQSGTMTFDQVYHDYNGDEHTDTQPAEGEEDAVKPINPHAAVLGAEGTNFASDNYETAKAMANGEVKLIEKADGAGYTLLVKRELSEDQYYVDNLDMSLRHMVADDEYQKDMEKYAGTLKVKTDKSAVDRFKVKKIVYPSANQA